METILPTCVIFLQALHIFATEVKISGPLHVQRNKPLPLNCSSTIAPLGNTVEFLVNDESYANIYMKDGRCHKGRAECFDEECICYNGGRSYYLQYKETQHTEVVKFSCLMIFDSGQHVFDSINIQIVDVDGPFITSVIAGTKTTLLCSVNTTIIEYDLTLNCFNKTVSHALCSSCVASMEIDIKSELTGNVCTCYFKWKELLLNKSTDVDIKKTRETPVISLNNTIMCFSQEPVVLTSRLCAELSSFGFTDWTHNVNGNFIRYIKSNQIENTAQLAIKSCTYMDIGDYRCTAYNNYGNETIWASKTTTITMLGPPVVVHSFIVQGIYTVLTTFCYSVNIINETKWYFLEEVLENSSRNVQIMAKEIVPFPMHNKMAEIPVHVINLTIREAQSGLYSVVITNIYGEAKHQFQLKKDFDAFNLSVIIWGLIAIGIFLVTFSVSTIVVRGCVTNAVSSMHNTPVIYHAAPYFEPEVHSYDTTDPKYDECDVSMSGSVDRRINQNSHSKSLRI